MTLYTLQFVDSISGSASLRLDLNDQTTWAVTDDTQFEAPRLRRAVATTMMIDGAQVTASAYEPRKLTLVLQMAALSVDNSALALQNLGRELDRTLNVLKYKPGTTNACYFRIYRSDFTDVKFNEATRQARVELYAEPFAYGEQQTVSDIIQFSPSAASKGQYMDVSSLKGDVPTPVIFSPNDDDLANTQSAIATWRRTTSAPTSHVVEAEAVGLTYGTDTASQAVTGFSNGNGARVTFATNATMIVRISGSASLKRGRYRAFVRLKKNTSTDQFFLKLKVGGSTTNLFTGGTVTTASTATTNITMVDLGLFNYPYGVHPIYDGISGTEMTTGTSYFELHASRQSGSGTLDIDYIAFLPADDQFSIISWGSTQALPAVPLQFRWDGYSRTVYLWAPSLTQVWNKTPASIVGNGALYLSPGVTNRIYFVPDVTPAAQFTNSGSVSVDIYYYPRYLHVRPVST